MIAPGTLISTPGDFRNVKVYEQQKDGRTIYRILFKNPEWEKGFDMVLAGMGALALAAVMFGGPVAFPQQGAALFFGGGVCLVIYGIRFKLPWKIDRTIELDMGMDRLRSFRKNRVVAERQLSRMANLTVDEHPAAEEARIRRQQKNQRKLWPEEKQHCLFGWFGAGGSEKVMLVDRYEWPAQNSLFEVRQAILWTLEQAAGVPLNGPHQPAGEGPREGVRVGAQTMNPPLD